MSTQVPEHLNPQFENAVRTIRTARKGDEVIWGDRKQPATVVEASGTPGDDRYIAVRGPNGADYTIRENYVNGIPNFNVEGGNGNANDLTFADGHEREGRVRQSAPEPVWADVAQSREGGGFSEGAVQPTPNGGQEEPPEADTDPAEDVEAVEASEGDGGAEESTGVVDPSEHEWSEFDVSIGEGEMVASGEHATLGGHFTAIYSWEEDESAWRYDADQSTVGEDLNQSDRGRLLGMIEDELRESEEVDIIRTAPEGEQFPSDADPPEMVEEDDFDPETPPDANEMSGDEFVAKTGGGYTEFDELKDGSIEGDLDDDEEFLSLSQAEESPDDTWTFVDELRGRGYEVPKTVNNWHLVDFGIITDEVVSDQRKLAYFNIETGEFAGMVGLHDEDSGESRWFVYTADDVENITAEERAPDSQMKDLEVAFNRLKRVIHDGDEEVDLKIEEDPNTGEVTVIDAISNTTIVRKIVAAKSADPFGVRTYISENDVPQWILDLDSALVGLYEFTASTAASTRRKMGEFADGAKLPTPTRIRAFLNGLSWYEIGYNFKQVLVYSAAGLKKRYDGITFSPVIKKDALGLNVAYNYTPTGGSATTRRRRRTRGGSDLDLPPEESFQQVTVDPRAAGDARFLLDTRLPSALSYAHLLHVADWANVNEWVFQIPDPWDDQYSGVSFGRIPGGPTSASGAGVKQTGDVDNISPNELTDVSRLRSFVGRFSDDEQKVAFLGYLAATTAGTEHLDERDVLVEEKRNDDDLNQVKSLLGEPRSDLGEALDDHGYNVRQTVQMDPLVDMVELAQAGMSPVDAVNTIISERDIPVATSADFGGYTFTTGKEPAEPQQSEDVTTGAESVPEGEGGPGIDEPVGSSDEPRFSEGIRAAAEELAQSLETGSLRASELTPRQRDALLRAEERQPGLLPQSTETAIRERAEREGGPLDRESEKFAENVAEAMVEHLREEGSLDEVANMTEAARQASGDWLDFQEMAERRDE